MKKILMVIITVITALGGSVVLADGAPSYNKNMYTVVVNNRDGAEVKYNEYDETIYGQVEKTTIVPYGTKFIVQDIYEKDEGSVLKVNSVDYTPFIFWGKIDSSDVEIYGESVTPEELRNEGWTNANKNGLLRKLLYVCFSW
ncbi:MAG: hypothetical protein IKJ32_03290 [Clostridia bacterium]|nr:hypothetical protein [Clostridia bacterium]